MLRVLSLASRGSPARLISKWNMLTLTAGAVRR